MRLNVQELALLVAVAVLGSTNSVVNTKDGIALRLGNASSGHDREFVKSRILVEQTDEWNVFHVQYLYCGRLIC